MKNVKAAKPKILIADKVSAESAKILAAGGLDVAIAPGLAPKDLARRLQSVDGVIVRSATKIRADVLGPKTKIRVIGRAGIGVDNIDVDAASELGIAVLNTPDANATTTAELAVAHLFSISRTLPAADASVRAGKWERSRFVGSEISGKVVGVLGFGTIGKIVAHKCRALGLRVLVCDPFVADEVVSEAGFEPHDLAGTLSGCDYLTIHAPLTKDTIGLIGGRELARMKPSAYLIHCARGGMVDEKALARALNGEKLAGAAIDVFSSEPPAAGNPLLTARNTVFTPHLGASTREAQAATGKAIAEQLVTFFATGEALNAVNIPRIRQHEIARAQPYCELMRILGKIMAAAAGSKIKHIGLQLGGDAAELSEPLLLNEALIGLLADSFATPVNQVNALRMAANHGISSEVTKSKTASGFAGLVGLQVTAGRQARSVAGTLLGGLVPHLVRLDDCELEAPLSGHALITRHDDRPGVIAKVAQQLARQRLNITNMHVGQSSRSGKAAALIGISKPLPDATRKAIDRIAEVREILSLRF